MKHIYAAFLFIFYVLSFLPAAQAQRVLYDEDFKYYAQVNFSYPWKSEGSTGSFDWRCDVPYYTFGLGFLQFENTTRMAGTASNGNCQDVLLVTPAISLSGVRHAFLRYDSYFLRLQNGGKTESARVEVSTDDGASWTALKDAPVSTGGHMARGYVDLSAYAGLPALRLGFRYSDSMKPMFGWMVDNIKVYEPSEDDISLIHTYPDDPMTGYVAVPSDVTLRGMVMNTGINPITSFTVSYRTKSGTLHSETISGVRIGPFDSLMFMLAPPYSVGTVGAHPIRMWATTAGDTMRSNDTMPLLLHGALFIPDKKIAVEEGTATWSIYSPRGYTYLHALDQSDHPPVRICVHSNDIMDLKPYADYLYDLNQNFLPYILFDRRGPVRPQEFFEKYERESLYFGFADLDLKASFVKDQLTVETTIRPAVDLPGRYRIALVITEDGIKGTGKDYEQANAFAGGRLGVMGGFEKMSDPVPASDMVYDYVARSVSPSPGGGTGCGLDNLKAGQSYPCPVYTTYSSKWAFRNLKANILLIRDADNSVLNSKSASFTALDVAGITAADHGLAVRPNPAGDVAHIEYALSERSMTSIYVTDITGRTVYQSAAGWMSPGSHRMELHVASMPSGMYFVTLETGQTRSSVKLSVAH